MSSGLSEEQWRKIEENRQKALARRAERLAAQNQGTNLPLGRQAVKSVDIKNSSKLAPSKANHQPQEYSKEHGSAVRPSHQYLPNPNNQSCETSNINNTIGQHNSKLPQCGTEYFVVPQQKMFESGCSQMGQDPSTKLSIINQNVSGYSSESCLCSENQNNPLQHPPLKEVHYQPLLENHSGSSVECHSVGHVLVLPRDANVPTNPTPLQQKSSGFGSIFKTLEINSNAKDNLGLAFQTSEGGTTSKFYGIRSVTQSSAACSAKSLNNDGMQRATYSGIKANAPKKVQSAITGKCLPYAQDRFCVEVGFKAELITLFKSIPSRNYDPAAKMWNFSLDDYTLLMDAVEVLPSVGLKPLEGVEAMDITLRSQTLTSSPTITALLLMCNNWQRPTATVKGKVMLISRSHFEVEIGYHVDVIAIFKQMNSRNYVI